MNRTDDVDDLIEPDELGFVGRLTHWFQATPAELVGLSILVLGAIAVTVTLWLQSVQRPDDLPNDAVTAGVPTDGEAGDGASDEQPSEGAGDSPGSADDTAAGFDGAADPQPHADIADPARPGEDTTSVGDPGSANPGHGGTNDPGGSAGGDPGGGSGSGAGEASEPEEIAVHVTGAVGEPGLVTVPSGSRVADAVTAAGGMTDEAEPTLVNLARLISDGEHVHVPIEGEDPPVVPESPPAATEPPPDNSGPPDAGTDSGGGTDVVININEASASELEALPGIGPSRAEAIVAYREENGPFATPGDLRGVTGIGEMIFQNLADRVTVG